MDVTGQPISGKLWFPDGSEEEVRRWKDLLVKVARWALSKLQQAKKLPLPKPKITSKNIISKDPKEFRSPKEIEEGWYVETWLSAKDCVHLACHILKKAGVNPDEVKVLGWKP